MAALYEIDRAIQECIDIETGEILLPERLNSLQVDRKTKIRNIACYIKSLLADSRAYEEEEKTFQSRKKAAVNKAESLKNYLSMMLQGEAVKDKEFAIGWRKSEQLQIADDAVVPEAFMISTEPKINKAGLKEALKNGDTFRGVQLVQCNNIQIK